MRLIDGTIDLLEKTGFDLILLAILDGLEQEILERGSLEQFAQNIIDPAAQGFASRFELFQKPGVDFTFARVGP